MSVALRVGLLLCVAGAGACASAAKRVGTAADASVLHDATARDAGAAPDATVAGDSAAGSSVDARVTSGLPDASLDAADKNLDSAIAIPGSRCPSQAHYPAPLSASTLSATKLQGGFNFTEGPVWIAASGVLLFSDLQPAAGAQAVQPSVIRRFTPPGQFDVWLASAGTNGLALWPDGKKLVACTQDQQDVSSYDLVTQQRQVLATSYLGKHLHSPNDVAVRSDTTLYFTDPNFQQGNRTTDITPATAVYRVAASGSISVVDDTITNPNGIALSPDEATLYVDGTSAGEGQVWKYAVHADGSTGPAVPLVAGLRSPDGMTVDCAGNLYVAEYDTGKVHVYAPSGAELGTIAASLHTTNAAFGGADGKTLFITSGDGSTAGSFGLYAVQLAVPGLPY